MATINGALQVLNKLLENGMEFPDAAYHVAYTCNVNQAKLEKAYDEAQHITNYRDATSEIGYE